MTDGSKPDINLLKSSYHFELPQELIAQRPTSKRDACQLLAYSKNENQHQDLFFYQIKQVLPKNTLLVFNHSKVVPCRLFGNKLSGGKVEVFILNPNARPDHVPCMIRTSGKKKIGDEFIFEQNKTEKVTCKIIDRLEDHFIVEFSCEDLIGWLNDQALMPIPPYIRDGVSDEEDKEDYQTIYAEKEGSIAAPTAGLHFTEELIQELKDQGHDVANVCLHVGAGTFAPVKTDNILDHQMHRESFEIEEEDYQKIKNAETVIAVGTTSLRVLESVFQKNKTEEIIFKNGVYRDSTDIFLYPGKEIESIQGIITNFHLPESTLIMLVSCLVGREKTLELYRHAVEKKYRFYSYGDAMLLLK